MKEIPRNHKKPYGECALCTHIGTVKYHHIIPKRYKIKTNRKAKLIWGNEEGRLFYMAHKQRIENLMIQVCMDCHKKLHPENWKYNLNEKMSQNEYITYM